MCHLVASGVKIRFEHPIFKFIIYIFHLYEEDCSLADILCCLAIALPST